MPPTSLFFTALAVPLALVACVDVEGASSPEPIYLRTAQGILPVVPVDRGDGWVEIQDDLLVRADELARNTIPSDMLEQALRQETAGGTLFGAVRAIGSLRWADGIVRFQFAAELTAAQRQNVQDAMDHWEENTPFRFVAVTSGDRVQFITGADANTTCQSALGRQGGLQTLEVETCPVGTLIHEIGHAIGFFHEQSRSDRDTYVTINWDNITDATKVHNFEKYYQLDAGNDGQDLGPYDYGSIFHYGEDAFGTDTITPVQSGVTIGQRNGLSLGDRYAAYALYQGVNMTGATGPQVTLYRDPSYGGVSQSFRAGFYAAASLNMLDVIGDDTASSIRVPPGLVARLCIGNGEPDLGSCYSFTADTAQLPASIDNRTSVVDIDRAVTAYRGANLTGVSQTFARGTYRADLNQMSTVGNDQITSLVVPAGLVVELCTSEAGTTCQTFEGTVNNVGATLDNRASLVRVKAAVTLFQEARLWGTRTSLVAGTYASGAFTPVANNAVSSLVVGEGLQAVLCDGSTGGGPCQTFRGDVVFVGTPLNDKASYLRVEANDPP